MYRNFGFFVKRPCKTRNVPGSFRANTSQKIGQRLYHSDPGVYGHRPTRQKEFEVPKEILNLRAKHSNFYRLLTAYRQYAHRQANINPVALSSPEPVTELELDKFGLDLEDRVPFKGFIQTSTSEGTIEDSLKILNKLYCGTLTAEFNHLETEAEREWFAEHFEKCHSETISNETKRAIATEMIKSQAFDRFMAIKFVSVKRYGGEGAESMMAFFHELFELSSKESLKELILCMPHRGRLNLLTGMLKFPAEKLFRKFKGLSEFPEDVKATGDVASHFISSVDLQIFEKKLHVSMLYNPSHLEAVNPVSMGKTRAVMQILQDGVYSSNNTTRWSDKVLNVQVHGDAAYAGQGVNQECLSLSQTPHFEIGGTIHLVVNNQLGFTTPACRGRSSRYCTDLAKSISAPVLHVNADDPEMVVRAARVAFNYQREFRKDVYVDLNCFRRWGHNELDDPTFTNPRMYKIIHNRPSIPDRYVAKLVKSNIITEAEAKSIVEKHTAGLNDSLKQLENYTPQPSYFTNRWSFMKQAESAITSWDTGFDVDILRFIADKSVKCINSMDIHPQLKKSHIQSRLKRLENGSPIDWSMAEAMAFGSLLYQGYNVRISGQDVGRGTFSHRHAMLVDQSTGCIQIPLNSITEGQTGKLELANSILSEEAVLGFEYGVSITSPTILPIWEAQFGDFFNGAQIIIDTFIGSGEAKWMTCSGLTMLLPHGYDGAGPDHSSCRLERFLQLTDSNEDKPDGDDVNMQVANPTTPAQYFHLLRRQMVRNFRKPLVIVAPKTLLRHALASSTLHDMAPGTSFNNVIGDKSVDESNVTKVVLVSGKHYYALNSHRESIGATDVAIIRVESLCPFPVLELNHEIQKYNGAKIFVWSQEEPQNMGAWSFIKPRFEHLCGRQLRYAGRNPLATPAVGVGEIHRREADEVIMKPFALKA